jgi:hypothetical protein
MLLLYTFTQLQKFNDPSEKMEEFYRILNPSRCTMALVSTRPLTEVSTGNLPPLFPYWPERHSYALMACKVCGCRFGSRKCINNVGCFINFAVRWLPTAAARVHVRAGMWDLW